MSKMAKNIAVIGKPASGKSHFIQTAKCNGLTKYYKTIGLEAHPMGPYNGHNLTVWEFGHYSNLDAMKDMDAIIYITKNDADYTSEKPYVIVKNNKVDPIDAEAILKEIANKL